MTNKNELKRMNFTQAIIKGFKLIGQGLGKITLFPSKRYSELNMEEYRNGFERDKKSLENDWEKIVEDWNKVCPFQQ